MSAAYNDQTIPYHVQITDLIESRRLYGFTLLSCICKLEGTKGESQRLFAQELKVENDYAVDTLVRLCDANYNDDALHNAVTTHPHVQLFFHIPDLTKLLTDADRLSIEKQILELADDVKCCQTAVAKNSKQVRDLEDHSKMVFDIKTKQKVRIDLLESQSKSLVEGSDQHARISALESQIKSLVESADQQARISALESHLESLTTQIMEAETKSADIVLGARTLIDAHRSEIEKRINEYELVARDQRSRLVLFEECLKSCEVKISRYYHPTIEALDSRVKSLEVSMDDHIIAKDTIAEGISQAKMELITVLHGVLDSFEEGFAQSIDDTAESERTSREKEGIESLEIFPQTPVLDEDGVAKRLRFDFDMPTAERSADTIITPIQPTRRYGTRQSTEAIKARSVKCILNDRRL